MTRYLHVLFPFNFYLRLIDFYQFIDYYHLIKSVVGNSTVTSITFRLNFPFMNKFVPVEMLTGLHLHRFFQLTDFYERDRVRKHCNCGRYIKNYGTTILSALLFIQNSC